MLFNPGEPGREMLERHVTHLINVAKRQYQLHRKELETLDSPPTEKQFVAVYLIAHKNVMDVLGQILEGKPVHL